MAALNLELQFRAVVITSKRFAGRTKIIQRGEAALQNHAIADVWRAINALKHGASWTPRLPRDTSVDPLATRQPRHAECVILTRKARAAYEQAAFRHATHWHRWNIEIVEPGAEGIVCERGATSPRNVGLPNSYAKKAFSVATSQHTIRVSRAFLRVPAAERSRPGTLMLSPTCRVRQGRGTLLVVEHLEFNRRGRPVWR